MPDVALTLPSYLRTGMVLQQQTAVRILGLATPRAAIELQLERHPAPDQTVSSLDRRFGLIHRDTTEASRQGHFEFILPPLQASYCRYTLTLSTLTGEDNAREAAKPYVRAPGMPLPLPDLVVIDDILVGEVWVSGGQDNMVLPLGVADRGQHRQLLDDNDHIRFLLQDEEGLGGDGQYQPTPRERLMSPRWTRAGRILDLRQVSAAAAHFAHHLQQSLDVPVGIVSTEVSGSLLHSWIDYDRLAGNETARRHLKRIRLWRDAESWEPEGRQARFQPAVFFNQKVAPLRGLSCRGLLWYQGESDVAFPDYYAELLPRMLESWLTILRPVDDSLMHFVYCQLAPYCYPTLSPEALPRFNAMLARIRAELPVEAGLVAIHDLPLDYRDLPRAWRHPLHPQAKAELGWRCARIALGLAYAWPGAHSSPELISCRAVGDKLLLAFSAHGEALQLREGTTQPRGFELAGADGVFRPARARLLFGVEVMLWHPEVPQPVFSQYGCRELNDDAGLMTADGLAIVPFSTAEEGLVVGPDLRWMNMDQLSQWSFVQPEQPRPLPDGAGPAPLFSPIDGVEIHYELEHGQRHEGASALMIRYRSLRPVFTILKREERYLAPRPPLVWPNTGYLQLAIFSRDSQPKRMRLGGQEDWVAFERSLSWQEIRLPLAGAALDNGLVIELEDRQLAGSLLIDDLRILPATDDD